MLDKAVQLLAQRNHSSHELKQKLTQFCFKKSLQLSCFSPQEVVSHIDQVVELCVAKRWLDDKLYIEQYIDLRIRKGYGKARILKELEQKGLDDNTLNQAIIDEKNLDWLELGSKQLLKKFKNIDKTDIKQKAKVYQFLAYKGFSHDEISAIYKYTLSLSL
ncbi:regulatory protein RecX [Orbaceae bacterium ac157xtp]